MAATEHPRTPVLDLRPSPGPSIVLLALGGAIARSDIPMLCARAKGLLEGNDATVLLCDVGEVLDPEAVTIDALARLQLTARRLGYTVQLQSVSAELRALLVLAGLCEAVPPYAGLSVEAQRQAEGRKQRLGVQEEAESDDPFI